ncbi:MAG: anthranilate phosphoribosyltransferase [Crocinitomicaceae bacterium]|jgi:anthranilate phosphoribosyltransferase
MTTILDKILAHEHLSFEEAKHFIYGIEEERYTQETIAGILVGIQMRGVQLVELRGLRSALLELCEPITIESENAIDLCGTGGDGKNTFNISTTASFVLAGMGKKVIKHGNYGVSSLCGSSNVLEEIGVQFTTNSGILQDELDRKNICFLHAPLFHPTMKKVACARRNLGIRTIFNCLGPLVNPAQPKYQLTGTYSLELAKIYQHILQNERTDFGIAYGMDGYDEITLTNDTRLLGKTGDEILNAGSFSAQSLQPSQIHAGKTVKSAAKIMSGILSGKGSKEQNQVTAANVAAGLRLFHPETSIEDLYQEAIKFIQSGHASQIINLN